MTPPVVSGADGPLEELELDEGAGLFVGVSLL
jgi:hypothetical protein